MKVNRPEVMNKMSYSNRRLIDPHGPLMTALAMSDRIGPDAAHAWLMAQAEPQRKMSRRARREQRRRDKRGN